MARKKSPETTELGTPGLAHSYGYMREEPHPKLKGRQAALIFQEMADNDATIGAALYSIEGFLRKIDWVIAPASDTTKAVKEAEFVRGCLDDMRRPFSDFISDVMKMLVYGYSFHEVVYKYRKGDDQPDRFRSRYDDGRIGWADLATRAQASIQHWIIDEETGEILGAEQLDPTYTNRVTIPMSRAVLFRTSCYKNNPEGRSVIRNAYRSWHFKKRLEEIEAIGLSRALVNIPVYQIPARFMSPNATAAEKAVRSNAERTVSLLANDRLTGLVVPSELDDQGKPTGYKFSTLNAATAQVTTDPVIRRYDTRILMSLAAEFLALGTEKTGSFALGIEKATNFVRSLERYADIIADQFNSVLIPRLMRLNAVEPKYWPKFTNKPIDKTGITELGQFLSQAGEYLTPTHETENAIREMAKLPPIDEADFEEAKAAELAANQPAPSPTANETKTDASQSDEDP